MKVVKIYLLVIFLYVAADLAAQKAYPIHGSYQGMSFTDFVQSVEDSLHIRFFYKSEWVQNIRIKNKGNCTDLDCLLNNTFAGTTLHYFITEWGHIIITQELAIKSVNSAGLNSDPYISTGQHKIISENSSKESDIIEIGQPSEKYKSVQAVLSGYIKDNATNEVLPGVTVFNKKLAVGTISNEYGYYFLSLPKGIHTIQFTSLGMQEKSVVVNMNSSGEMNIEMESQVIPLKAVVVTSEKSFTLQRFEVGVERINMKTYRLMPTTMGEVDVMKSLLLIPGVKSVGEGASGINVRGGTTDQNLILLYGAPLYNTSHFFGFFSAVNSDIIRDITLYKGGIPAKYGGRISSVLDIGTRDGNRKEFHGNAGISPVTTHLAIEGPLIKDTLSYIFAARTTYSSWILKLINDPEINRSRAAFYDANGKVTYDPDINNRFELAGYYSSDNFRFNIDSLYHYENHIYSFKWRHSFNSHLIASVSLSNSMYYYTLSSEKNRLEAFCLSHELNNSSFKTDFNWFAGKNEIGFGTEITRYKLHPGDFGPNNASSLVRSHKLEKEQALESAIYIDDKIILTEYLSIDAGLRISGFFILGPKTVFQYNPEQPMSISGIIDSSVYKRGDLIAKYGGPEARLALNFRISDKNSFKINYNRTLQYLHLLSNSYAISPTDIWKLSDYYIRPKIGDQIAVGFYSLFPKSHLEFSSEIYCKFIRNMVEFKGGTKLTMNENIEKNIVPARAKAYGLEISLRKNEGKLQYSLGYTFSRIMQQSQSKFEIEQINSGRWFPANFDSPHDLSVICSYLISRRLSFSGNYTLYSGRPITFPVAAYIFYDNKYVHYSERNKYRIPDYSRLDLSVTLNGNLRSHKITQPKWTFSIFNVLARKNVYSVYFKRDGDIIKGYKLTIFGRAIPSLTYSFDF
ncbi:MAG TPA: TonB-dependent receptor [Bacteroidales bacterium]|nr:TonB-dependent receptor [Bacteroidales bacterium]